MQDYADARSNVSDRDRSITLALRAMRIRLKQASNASLDIDWSANLGHAVQ